MFGFFSSSGSQECVILELGKVFGADSKPKTEVTHLSFWGFFCCCCFLQNKLMHTDTDGVKKKKKVKKNICNKPTFPVQHLLPTGLIHVCQKVTRTGQHILTATILRGFCYLLYWMLMPHPFYSNHVKDPADEPCCLITALLSSLALLSFSTRKTVGWKK